MEIKKINELDNTESFIQINFVKGFEYIDKAGKITNFFNTVPKNMNMYGMAIEKSKKEEVRITPYNFWSHFILPDSLGQISDSFVNDAEGVLKIIKVEEITRIGWRNYFIYKLNKDKEIENALNKFIQKENLNFNSISFSCKENGINFNFRVEKLADKEDGNRGILIDVDSFKDFTEDNLLMFNKEKDTLKEIREKIQSKSFLDVINFILAENDV